MVKSMKKSKCNHLLSSNGEIVCAFHPLIIYVLKKKRGDGIEETDKENGVRVGGRGRM